MQCTYKLVWLLLPWKTVLYENCLVILLLVLWQMTDVRKYILSPNIIQRITMCPHGYHHKSQYYVNNYTSITTRVTVQGSHANKELSNDVVFCCERCDHIFTLLFDYQESAANRQMPRSLKEYDVLSCQVTHARESNFTTNTNKLLLLVIRPRKAIHTDVKVPVLIRGLQHL